MIPEDVLPITVELDLDGWTDVTSYVQRRDLIQITRGRSDEASQADPARCQLTLDNRNGRFSPRNPTSPYGVLGRNTPIRVSVESGEVGLLCPEVGDYASAPDSSGLSITGDIDIRVEAELADWRGDLTYLAGKYQPSGNQRSWAVGLSAGYVFLHWSANGTTTRTEFSTLPVPVPGGRRLALRVTMDVNDVSGGHVVTFYTSDSIGGSWTQLGDTVTGSGTTSIFDSTVSVEVGDVTGLGDEQPVEKRVYGFQLRSGINGTVVASPDFTAQTPGAPSFQDAQGNVWTVQSGAEITNRRYRFHGEVSEWPQRWDPSGTDVYVPIEASGVLRRLGRGSTVLGSAMYRGRLRDTVGLVAYWPAEDEQGATEIAPALNHPGMTITGSPDLASYEGFVSAKPIPVLKGSEWRGAVPTYTDTGQIQVRWLMAVPEVGAEDGQTILLIYTTGSIRRVEVYYGTGGTLGIRVFDASGTELDDTGDVAFDIDGLRLLVSLELLQDGSDVVYAISTLEPGAVTGLTFGDTLSSQTIGRVGTVVVSPGGGVAEVAIGHVSVQSAVTTLFDLGPQLAGWDGERAGRRIERLCAEEGLAFRATGQLDESVRLGVQRPGALIELLREAAEADGGVLCEPREVLGLGYRTRGSLSSQEAAVALDYTAGHLSPPLELTDDDRYLRNDVTVTREGGGSARAAQETGPLSVQEPPDGVGRYEAQVTLGVQYDLDLFDQASWRLHLGTVDEARYPAIAVNLARAAITSDAGLTAAIVGADLGDRITIGTPPAWLPPEPIDQLIQGYVEVLGNYEWQVTWTCAPASPYNVAVFGTARYGPYSTVLAEDLDATETGVDIDTPLGPLWDTTASGFDIVIGGERMTVTAVGSPSGTQQTLTVVRSVNGVVKPHSTGTAVELADQTYYAL